MTDERTVKRYPEIREYHSREHRSILKLFLALAMLRLRLFRQGGSGNAHLQGLLLSRRQAESHIENLIGHVLDGRILVPGVVALDSPQLGGGLGAQRRGRVSAAL